jgi:site-specific recombinase XerC
VQKNRSHDIPAFRILDSSENTLEVFRIIDPGLPVFAHRIITGYRPKGRSGAWTEVRQFVISCVLAMRPRTHENTRRLMTMTALYSTWVWTVSGVALDPGKVFTNNLLARYIADTLAHHSDIYRFDTTRQISTIAARLGQVEIDRLPTPSQSERVAPHTASDIATISSWAASLPTEMTRRNGRALLGLAGGAGLASSELMDTCVEDIEDLGDRMVVSVHGRRARRVPVVGHWTRILRKSIDGRSNGLMFKGYRLEEYPPRALQTFISEYPCSVRPSAARLHSAWIVEHLNANVPLPVLMDIAGFASAQSVQPYLAHARPQSSSDYFDLAAQAEVLR